LRQIFEEGEEVKVMKTNWGRKKDERVNAGCGLHVIIQDAIYFFLSFLKCHHFSHLRLPFARYAKQVFLTSPKFVF